MADERETDRIDSGGADPGETVTLRDGRTLRYSESGAPDGFPVLFFHGTPGSRVCIPDRTAVADTGVRFITVDRPGYGGSSPDPDRTVADWADDVEQLADALALDRFAVAGLSGGGPHALACGARLPGRVTNVAVVSGMAPLSAPNVTDGMSRYNRLGFLVARHAPFLLPLALRSLARQARDDPVAVVDDAASRYAPADRRVMERPEVRATMARELEAAYRQGATGQVADLKAVARPWGFRLDSVSVPVRIWHGGEDRTAPLEMGEFLADSIPESHLTIFQAEGHLVAYDHFSRILAALAAGPSKRRVH